MKKIIHNIRQKPSHHRDRIIWIAALVAVLILLGVWAIVGNGRRITPDQNFFQSLNQGLEEGKNTFPENPLNP
jgi:hypothetical protein